MLASDSESEDDSADEEKRLGSGRDQVQDRRSRAAERLVSRIWVYGEGEVVADPVVANSAQRNEAAGAGYAAGGLGR